MALVEEGALAEIAGMNFFGQALKIFAEAESEAERFNHHYVGTEHFLIACVRDDTLPFKHLGMTLKNTRATVEFIIGRSDQPTTPNALTPKLKKVIRGAAFDAKLLDMPFLSQYRLALRLISSSGDGIATGVLESLAVPLPSLRQAIIWAEAAAEHQHHPDSIASLRAFLGDPDQDPDLRQKVKTVIDEAVLLIPPKQDNGLPLDEHP